MNVSLDIVHKTAIKSQVLNAMPVNKVYRQISDMDYNSSQAVPGIINLIKKVMLVLKKKPLLNPAVDSGNFFGLESYEKMSMEKTEALFTYFKNIELGDKFFDIEGSQSCSVNDNNSLVNLFKGLKPNFGCTKITFNDKCFNGAFHTLGFVRDKGILYVLDSLGHNKNVNLNILKFHNKLKNLLSACKKDSGLEKIILNQKTQQSIDELTCNHWSYANIEALIRTLKSGKTVKTKKELDSILPADVNKILDEQKRFVLDRHAMYTTK